MAGDTAHAVTSGLDALDTAPGEGHTGPVRWVRRVVLPKLVAVATVLVVWQVVTTRGVISANALAAPGDVWAAFVDQWRQGHVSAAIWTSLSHAAVGYLVAVAVGTPLGLMIARLRIVRLAVGSLVSSLQSLPSVVWVPFALVLFGLDSVRVVYFVVIMGAFPSVAMGMTSAVDAIPPLLPRVGRVLGARGFALYRYVIIPAALPGYIAGLKQGWAFSWRSLMAAEIITQSSDLGLGLGQLLDSGRQTLDAPLVNLTIILILVVGVSVDGLVFGPLDRMVRRRRGLGAV